MKQLVVAFFVLTGLPVLAGPFLSDILVLGEVHDNPHHHTRQAEIVAGVKPKALVFEMLTGVQAEAYVPGADADSLAAAFGWAEAGWPDFEMYHPIFAAAPQARVFGAAIPRAVARQSMTDGLAVAFGEQAAAYGLTTPLAEEQQQARESFQMAAHCNALPQDMLPRMVDIQRLRDAQLARVAREALDLTGGPVVVITGNGHARSDWGVPVYLRHIAPDISVMALGQGEDGLPPVGTFDVIVDSPGVARGDPCAAFK